MRRSRSGVAASGRRPTLRGRRRSHSKPSSCLCLAIASDRRIALPAHPLDLTSFFVGKTGEHNCSLRSQVGNIHGGSRPNDVPADTKILVDCDVAQRDCLSPLNLRVPALKFWGKAAGRLANDGQLLEDRTLAEFIVQKLFSLQAIQKPGDSIRSVDDIGQVQDLRSYRRLVHSPGPSRG